MLLFELFGDVNSEPPLTDDIKQDVMDILTPLVAAGIKEVTVQQVIDKMNSAGSGLTIDRALIMDVLNPDNVGMVKKIVGDTIYLEQPMGDDRAVGADDAQKDQDHVSNMAQSQAKKSMDSGPL